MIKYFYCDYSSDFDKIEYHTISQKILHISHEDFYKLIDIFITKEPVLQFW